MDQNYNVILVGIDTLRADHLGIYGYERNTSPAIDALARESVIFQNCFSQASTTAPSFMSIMTSRYPTYHGVTSVIGGVGRNGRVYAMDEKVPTLAQILKQNGYSTGAFTDGGNLYDKLGFGKGFDFYSMNLRAEGKKVGLIQENDIFYWLQEHREKKFFLFLHTFAPHEPWLMPRPYLDLFDKEYKGKIAVTPELVKNLRLRGLFPREYLLQKADSLGREDIDYLKAIYDGSIVYVDNFMKNLLLCIKNLRIDERTIIIFTADHGEEFFDHGMLSHRQLYNELLHVPLILKTPTLPEPAVINRLVRSIDIFPTIFNLLQIKIDIPIHGVSLLKTLEKDLELSTVAESEGQGYSIQNKQYKYIYPRYKSYKVRVDELYDIKIDPGEKNNIALDNLDLVEKMLSNYNDELHHRVNLKHPMQKVIYLDQFTLSQTYRPKNLKHG